MTRAGARWRPSVWPRGGGAPRGSRAVSRSSCALVNHVPLREDASSAHADDPEIVGVSQATPAGMVASGRNSRPFRGGGAPSGVAPTSTQNFGLGKPLPLARCRAGPACEISVRFPSTFGIRRVRGARRKDSGTIGRLGVRAAGRRAFLLPCRGLTAPCNFMRESAQSAVRTKAFRSSVGSERRGERSAARPLSLRGRSLERSATLSRHGAFV